MDIFPYHSSSKTPGPCAFEAPRRTCIDLFGVPEIICSYIVKGPDGKEHSTIDFIPPDSTFWNVLRSEDHKKVMPEDRVHSRHLFKTEGRDLLDASSPQELLEGILHGMIGV